MEEVLQNNAVLEKIFRKQRVDFDETFTANQLMRQSGSAAPSKSLSLAVDP